MHRVLLTCVLSRPGPRIIPQTDIVLSYLWLIYWSDRSTDCSL